MSERTEGQASLPVEVAGDALHVRRVFGEAYQEGGTLVIPVAKVMGTGGLGYGSGTMGGGRGESGPEAEGEGDGGGGAFGLRVKPVGVYTVRDGDVRWQPAMDLNRVILGGQILGAVTMLAIACMVRKRRR